MAMTNYTANVVIQHYFGSANAPTVSGNVYVGLFTTLPDCSDSVATVNADEVAAGNNYARVAVAKGTGGWTQLPVGGGSVQNAGTVTFPAANGSWGTVIGVGIWDVSTVNGGNCLFYAPLTPPTTITSGSTPATFNIGQIGLDFCGGCC